ncbi:hypothetical protein BGX24_002321 [Mortierella sp. AD032]|nr:hypothetical protein BGX24_002321 [Mortierella sp. AD032]
MSTFTTTGDNSNIQPNQQRVRHIFSNHFTNHFTNRPIFSVKTRLTPSWNRFVLINDICDALQTMDIA